MRCYALSFSEQPQNFPSKQPHFPNIPLQNKQQQNENKRNHGADEKKKIHQRFSHRVIE
jgi:hypothetical protein